MLIPTAFHSDILFSAIHCLLCNESKQIRGFLSHVRQKHLNYHRYKCTKCAFKSDDEDESTLHSLERNHYVKVSIISIPYAACWNNGTLRRFKKMNYVVFSFVFVCHFMFCKKTK